MTAWPWYEILPTVLPRHSERCRYIAQYLYKHLITGWTAKKAFSMPTTRLRVKAKQDQIQLLAWHVVRTSVGYALSYRRRLKILPSAYFTKWTSMTRKGRKIVGWKVLRGGATPPVQPPPPTVSCPGLSQLTVAEQAISPPFQNAKNITLQPDRKHTFAVNPSSNQSYLLWTLFISRCFYSQVGDNSSGCSASYSVRSRLDSRADALNRAWGRKRERYYWWTTVWFSVEENY